MSRLLEWFEVTPFVQKVSLLGLFLVIFGVGFYWLMAEPLVVEIDILAGELRTLDRKLKLETQSESQLGKAQKEISQWQSIVSRQEERLGLEVPMSQVLNDMSSIAQETGILLTLWKPKKPGSESSAAATGRNRVPPRKSAPEVCPIPSARRHGHGDRPFVELS